MMKYKICVSQDAIAELYNEAMNNNLRHRYGGFGSMSSQLYKVNCAVGIYKGSQIIGFGMTTIDYAMTGRYNIGVYIAKEHMGNGYGTALAKKLVEKTKLIRPDYVPCFSNERFYKKALGC